MKKLISLGAALVLMACGPEDNREPHILTVELEITDAKGQVQKLKQDCAHLVGMCSKTFKLETPEGEKTFQFVLKNEPLPSGKEEFLGKVFKAKTKKDSDRITLSQYNQKFWVFTLKLKDFKEEKITDVWKPGTKRTFTYPLLVGTHKLGTIKGKIY